MPNYRMLPPVDPGRQTVTLPGNGGGPRVISAIPGGYVDISPADAIQLGANGWLNLGLVGPTAQRPALAGTVDAGLWQQFGATAGRTYIDTDLGKLTAFDGQNWRDALSGNVV